MRTSQSNSGHKLLLHTTPAPAAQVTPDGTIFVGHHSVIKRYLPSSNPQAHGRCPTPLPPSPGHLSVRTPDAETSSASSHVGPVNCLTLAGPYLCSAGEVPFGQDRMQQHAVIVVLFIVCLVTCCLPGFCTCVLVHTAATAASSSACDSITARCILSMCCRR
jgi:hypothetical protein